MSQDKDGPYGHANSPAAEVATRHFPAYANSWDDRKDAADDAWDELINDYASKRVNGKTEIRDAKPTGEIHNDEAWIASDTSVTREEIR